MRSAILVPYDRLNRARGALTTATPQSHDIISVRIDGLIRSRAWNAQRLHLILSAAEHFLADLEAEGFRVHHVTAPTLAVGIAEARRRFGIDDITATEPSTYAQARAFEACGVRTVPDDFFLTPRAVFRAWASTQKSLKMEPFYREQRRRLGILMDGDQPVGGSWNLDAENRLPPPKTPHPWPAPLHHQTDEIDARVWAQIIDAGYPVVGAPPDGTWPTTREGALRQLSHFVEHGLAEFGPYEDAMPKDSWAVSHSLLSPSLNLGLITPDEAVAAVISRFDAGGIPLASCEGFVRQVIGWREYVNGAYWHFGPDYRDRNGLAAERPLLPLFEDPNATRMHCVGSILGDLRARGWTHHIPRLMVLSNLALITGVQPQAFLEWMKREFVDANDWVMVPNVIGMGVHADGGQMMTKPYAAGGAYISRMGQFCGDCAYDPKKRTGDTACPFTTLYWDFIDRHREQFARNPRIAQQVRGLDRLSDLDAVRARATEVLDGLERGEV